MNEALRKALAQVRVVLAAPVFLVVFTIVMILTVPVFVGVTGQSWAFEPIFPGAVIVAAQIFPVVFEELARLIAIAAAGLFGRLRAAALAGLLLGLLEKSFHIGRLFGGVPTVISIVEILLPTTVHLSLTVLVAKYGRGNGRVGLCAVVAAAILIHFYNNALLNFTARQLGIAPLQLGICLAVLLVSIPVLLIVRDRRVSPPAGSTV